MTADVLRRAATLMRERAQAATHGGVWMQFSIAGSGKATKGICTPELPHIVIADSITSYDPAIDNATHIASWHPAVAVAVADWLDRVARDEVHSLAEWGHRTASAEALGVARAYLGENEDAS